MIYIRQACDVTLCYSFGMTMNEVHELIRERARAQPYGWQTEFAKRLGVTRAYVSDTMTGRRPISNEHLHIYLDHLGLELTVTDRGER